MRGILMTYEVFVTDQFWKAFKKMYLFSSVV